MPILSKPSSAARTSLIYITIGALVDIWSGVWWWYLRDEAGDVPRGMWYLCIGCLLTGLALIVLGLAVGQIGRSARHAELPPEEVTRASVQAEQNAAARAPVVAPVNPAQPVAPNGQAPIPTAQVVAKAPVAQAPPTR